MDRYDKAALSIAGAVFIIGVFMLLLAGCSTAHAYEPVVLSDEDYHDQCVDVQFSPAIPCDISIRPQAAPLDCSQVSFSPRHPFCTIERRRLDFELYNCDGFSPQPPGCGQQEI